MKSRAGFLRLAANAAALPAISRAARAGLALEFIIISGSLIGMVSSLHSQTTADDVAAQIRSQGYQCDQPVTARRNVELSKADSAVWTLECRNATYRVRLDPDMTAHVVRLKRQTH
jgi:hypothetical protein